MREENNIKNRIGERKIMNCGEECEIVEYKNAKNIIVRFVNTEELVNCTYRQFKIGKVKSRFIPTVCGVGITGLEQTKENGKHVKSYNTWKHMLRRCYSEKYHQKQPTYKDCSVCDEWLFYPNFKEWFNKNYYEINNQRMELDKDILKKGNKVYSPENCVFVPQSINTLFIKKNANRGELPIGVSLNKETNKYQTYCNIFDASIRKNKNKNLGSYTTPEEAFNAYKITKEDSIKLVAEYYKDRIPEKLYEAMYKYEVHIDD